jgi:hypothetical protein
MADKPSQSRRPDAGRETVARRRSAQPYRPPVKVHFAMYAAIVAILMAAAIMIFADRDLTWTWIFPAAAMAGAIYGYLHVRSAKTPGQGFAWVLVQVVCSLGAFALLTIPAKY